MIWPLVFTSGAGMSLVGPMQQADLAGVAAGQALQLALGELRGIDADAALGAAVGHVHGGVLDRHPGRQRHHLRQRHILVKAHAALAGAAAEVVLHAVALEVGDRAVVHLDGHIHDQDALWALERLHPAGQRAQIGRDAVHLLQVGAPGADVVGVQIGRQSMGYQMRGRVMCRHKYLEKVMQPNRGKQKAWRAFFSVRRLWCAVQGRLLALL